MNNDIHWVNYIALIFLYLACFLLIGLGIKNAEVIPTLIGCGGLLYSILLTPVILEG
jgi:hypothetical protein